MEKIASFTVDHNKLKRGMYISRVDGDVTTYDIRTRKPNVEEVMENGAIHTLEHLFATFVRNSKFKDNIIYFGPMGCRTGFYFLTTKMSHEDALALTKDALKFVADYEGEIPGVSAIECGNYRDHDLAGAKKEGKDQCEVLKNWTVEKFSYDYCESTVAETVQVQVRLAEHFSTPTTAVQAIQQFSATLSVMTAQRRIISVSSPQSGL